jgi:hypothetical protein
MFDIGDLISYVLQDNPCVCIMYCITIIHVLNRGQWPMFNKTIPYSCLSFFPKTFQLKWKILEWTPSL